MLFSPLPPARSPKIREQGKLARENAALAVERASRSRSVVAALEQQQPAFGTYAGRAAASADREADQLSAMTSSRVDAEEKLLRLRRKEAEGRMLGAAKLSLAIATGDANRVVASIQAEHVEIPLIDRSLQVAAARHGQLEDIKRRSTNVAAFTRGTVAFRSALAEHRRSRARLLSQKAALDALESARICRLIRVGCPDRIEIERHNEQVAQLKRNSVTLERWKRRLIARMRSLDRLQTGTTVISASGQIVADAMMAYGSALDDTRREAASYIANRSRSALRSNGWLAFGLCWAP